MTTAPELPAPRDPYAALRFRDFRLLILGRFIAQIGEMTVSVGVGWELYARTGDELALGLVGLVQILPVLTFGLYGGYVADRYDRKRIVLITQLVLIACSLALAGLSLVQGPLALIYGVLALIGTARAFNNPAEGALTPLVIPEAYYYNAASWSSSVWQLSAIIGPAVGGLIIGLTGAATFVYLLNAAAGAVLVAVLLMLRSKPRAYTAITESPLHAVREGWRFLRSSPVILAAISLDMVAVLLGGAVFLLPVFAADILFVDALGLGIMRAASSVGAVAMAIYLTRRPPLRHAGWTMLLAVAGFGAATIAFGLSTSFWFSVAMLALLGALDNISVVVRHTLILTHTPDAMRGRVGAVNSIFIGASNELGGFESGLLARLIGAVGAVVFGGVGTIVVVGIVAWLSPELRRMKTLATPAAPEPEALADRATGPTA
jgi:MFS family permease